MNEPLYETERLRVRRLRADDADAMFAVYSDTDAMRWVGDGRPITREGIAQWLVVTQRNVATRGYGMCSLIERDSGAIVGFCGLVHPGGQREPEVKYALARAFWGQGYATEAVRGMLDWGARTFGLTEVIATTAPANTASHAVLRKAGLAEGPLRDNGDGTLTQLFIWRGEPSGPPVSRVRERWSVAEDGAHQTDTAFSRASRREYGVPPTAWQRERRAQAQDPEMTSKVFVYGTLKEGFRNFHVNRGRRVPGQFVTVEPLALYVIGEFGLPWLVQAQPGGNPVVGQLFEVDDTTLAEIDRLERIDEQGWYQRRTLLVRPLDGGAPIEALAYLGSPERLAREVVHHGPLREYLAEHQALYRKHI